MLYARASSGLLFAVPDRPAIGGKATEGKNDLAEDTDNTETWGQEIEEPGKQTDDADIHTETVEEQIHEAEHSPDLHHEEQSAVEHAQITQAAKRNTRAVHSSSPRETISSRPTKTKRLWWGVLGIVSVVVGYFSLMGINSYQQTQRNLAATATQRASFAATVTQQGHVVNATATAMVNADGGKLARLLEQYAIEFLPVPGGPFMMGSPSGIGNNDEHPQFETDVDEFWIGLTEVTNAQYQHFVDADGYATQAWWTEAGWAWRTQDDEDEANDYTAPHYWDDEQWNDPNQPVVGVSWYEATAYASWLAAETGLDVRLPTEAEWEKAARGTDGRPYPWGDEAPTEQLLNYSGNVGRTVDVGSYPEGASPYGALDMAGNVWEWTATQWVSNYDNSIDVVYNGKEGSEPRALRGGAWIGFSNGVRSANRGRGGPGYRLNYVGFRLIVSAPGG